MNRSLENPLKDYWALTISPEQRNGKPLSMYKRDRDFLYQWLTPYTDHFIMYPEFTESGRLHYHGIIHISDRYKFYHTKHLVTNIGFTMWKPLRNVKDHLTWLTYCRKNFGISRMKPSIYMTYKNYKRYNETLQAKAELFVMEEYKKAKQTLTELTEYDEANKIYHNRYKFVIYNPENYKTELDKLQEAKV